MIVLYPFQLLYVAVLLGCCLYAGRYGGTSERVGVAICTLASGLSAAPTSFSFGPLSPSIMITIVDVTTLVALLVLALWSRSFWPLWATGIQLAALSMWAAMHLQRRDVLQVYVLVQPIWAYLVLLTLVLGARRHRRLAILSKAANERHLDPGEGAARLP